MTMSARLVDLQYAAAYIFQRNGPFYEVISMQQSSEARWWHHQGISDIRNDRKRA